MLYGHWQTFVTKIMHFGLQNSDCDADSPLKFLCKDLVPDIPGHNYKIKVAGKRSLVQRHSAASQICFGIVEEYQFVLYVYKSSKKTARKYVGNNKLVKHVGRAM